MSERKHVRSGMGLFGVLMVFWMVAQGRNGTERQLLHFAETGEVITWEAAQGCFSEEIGWARKLGRLCYGIWVGRFGVTQDRITRIPVTPDSETDPDEETT